MEQSVDSLFPRKRSARDLDSSASGEASAKRPCSEAPSASPHLTLLEELYDLEGEDEGAVMEVPLDSSTQEDLVAEMMKSLEKVIGESEESRAEGEEASTSNPSGFASADASPALEFTWGNEEIAEFPETSQNTGCHGELYEEDFKENAQIRELLQASDDELGLPISSSSSDLEESSFHEEWASLAKESSVPENFSWLDASFHQLIEEAAPLSKEIFEPLLLF